MQLTFPGALDAAMWSSVSLLQFLYPHLFVLQVLLREDFSSCELESLQMWIHRVNADSDLHGPVRLPLLTVELVPPYWIDRVISL